MGDSGHGMPEELLLYGMANDESTNSLTFHLWDAAVLALPIIAQLLLAALPGHRWLPALPAAVGVRRRRRS